jgi:hypothetical protein
MSVSPNTLLLEALQVDIEKLQKVRQEASQNLHDFAHVHPQTLRDLRGIAGNLADIYQGAETAFQRIARATQEGLPSGGQWHRQLLDQMSQVVAGVRPAVIRPETQAALEPFRSFRHLMRHLYGFDLEWAEMQPLVSSAGETLDLLISDLESFCEFLRQVDK